MIGNLNFSQVNTVKPLSFSKGRERLTRDEISAMHRPHRMTGPQTEEQSQESQGLEAIIASVHRQNRAAEREHQKSDPIRKNCNRVNVKGPTPEELDEMRNKFPFQL